MRILGAAVFAVAAAASALGGAGLVVVPHGEPAGSDPLHQHRVTVFRFPLALVGTAPGVPSADELAHHVRAAHADHLRSLLGLGGVTFSAVHPLAELAGAAVLALLVIAAPRLPRPTRRVVADMPIPRLVTPQWRSRLAAPPPRSGVCATA